MPDKERVIVVNTATDRGVYLADQIIRDTESGTWDTRLGDTLLRFTPRPGSRTVTVTTNPPGVPITKTYALWFAWHAMHPLDQPAGP